MSNQTPLALPRKHTGRYSDAVSDAVTCLMGADPFHAAMLMDMTVVETDAIPTAATDTYKFVWINPEFFAPMPPDEAAAVLAHEISHKVRLHGLRSLALLEREGRVNTMLYNLAGDFCINKDLNAMGYPFAQMAVRMGAKTVSQVCAELADPTLPGASDAGFCFDPSLDTQTDTEDLYARFVACLPPLPEGQGQGEGQSGGQAEAGAGGIGAGDDIMLEQLKQTMEDEGTTPESAEQETKVSIAAAAGAAKQRGIGTLPAGVQDIVDQLNKKTVDWRSHLRRFVSAVARDDWSYRRMHRRSVHPVVSPSLYSERPGVIGVVIDTSGSVSQKELCQAVAEVSTICRRVKPQEVIVLAVDTKVNNVARFKAGQDIKVFDANGRGGTDMTPGFEWFRENNIKPECVICLTDGELFRWPSRADMQGVPLFWGICNPHTDVARFARDVPYGHVVKIEVSEDV